MPSASAHNQPANNATSWVMFVLELWALRLPTWLLSWWSSAADAVADGGWLIGWPRIAAFSPLVAFTIGFLAPLPWFEQRIPFIYSESLWFMATVIAGAIFSGTMGMMLLIGYICGDLFWDALRLYSWGTHYASSIWALLSYRASRIFGYVLLGLLACQIPLVVRRLTHNFTTTITKGGKIPIGFRAAIYSVTYGMLVYFWCQSMIVLIRPVFTWVGHIPTVEAVRPVQEQWYWLVAAAMLAAMLRIALEHVKAPPALKNILKKSNLSHQYIAYLAERERVFHLNNSQSHSWTRIVLGSVTITVLLWGLYVEWMDALPVLVVSGVLLAWQKGRLGRLPLGWVHQLNRVPALLRVVGVSIIGYLLANQFLEQTWSLGTFRPVLIAILGTLVLYCLVFPDPLPVKASQEEGRVS